MFTWGGVQIKGVIGRRWRCSMPRRRFYSRWYHKLTEFPRAFYLGPGGARRDEPGGAPTAAGNSEK
jgi:hypothetical protein